MRIFINDNHCRGTMRVIAILLIIIFIVSCTPRISEQPVTDYRKGKEGVIIAFTEGTPPKKTYENAPFSVIVKVWNKGAYDNPYGRVYLGGFDPASILFSPQDQDLPPIQGSSQYLPGGGYDTLEFTATQVVVLSGDVYKPTLMASLCYNYMTLATPSVCIVPKPIELLRNKICEPKTITMQSQGAPVAVTRIDEEIMDGAVNFIITVQNVGGGTVVKNDNMGDCPWNLDYNEIDEVEAKVTIRSIGDGTCTPASNKIKLVDGKGVMSCMFQIPVQSGYDAAQTSYTTPLEIRLSYGYNSNIKKEIEIARIPGTKPFS
jgi:hypothetical protein